MADDQGQKNAAPTPEGGTSYSLPLNDMNEFPKC